MKRPASEAAGPHKPACKLALALLALVQFGVAYVAYMIVTFTVHMGVVGPLRTKWRVPSTPSQDMPRKVRNRDTPARASARASGRALASPPRMALPCPDEQRPISHATRCELIPQSCGVDSPGEAWHGTARRCALKQEVNMKDECCVRFNTQPRGEKTLTDGDAGCDSVNQVRPKTFVRLLAGQSVIRR